jgi:hypothetical protein
MAESKLTCVCGKEYFPNQAWLHENCKKQVEEITEYKKGWKTREEYRAYMKAYMRVWRAKRKT